MKTKKLLSIILAVVMMLTLIAIPAYAADVGNNDTDPIEPRQVRQQWTNLTIETTYHQLPTSNGGKISNWYGSYATFVFQNKTANDTVTLRVGDYDKNGVLQHAETATIHGNGGSFTVKVTPGAYYKVDAKSSKKMTGVNIYTYTDR